MKNSKKIIFGLGIALLSNFSQAQGLDGIVVEKFYQTNAADEANALSNGAATNLNVGSVVYRVYVDMAAGYKFSQLFGSAGHPLQVTTTTNFYNDPNSGSTTNPSAISTTNTRKNTALIDSWFTTGGIATGKVGVLKTEDTDGSPGNAQNVLQNNPGGLFGAPINIGTTLNAGAKDGMIAGSPVAPNVLGLTTELDVLDQTPGNSFSTTNGAIAALGGVTGATASNMVLVGQFTTDGVFGFQLNVQIVNISTGVASNYVAVSPGSGEVTHPSLTLAPNNPPTVSITAPANGASIITGDVVNITANAADVDGTVTGVEFFVDGNSIGVDATAPYEASYTSTVGAHTITAKATDDDADFTTSTGVSISVANNQAPTVSVSSAANAIVGDVVTFTSTASDVDGTVAQVEFLVDNVVVGTDATSPFSFDWTSTVGAHAVTARATDNLGLATTSSAANITVANNNPPTAVITSPLSTAVYLDPQVVTIEATATDNDGTVTQVEFFINNVSVGTDATAPYSFDWTSTPGVKNITVKSTDNKGAVTTSAVLVLNITDHNALPYEVKTVSQKCNFSTFNIPVAAAATYSADNVIGYDITLNYDKTKMTPTGNITVLNNLINASYVETQNDIDAINGTMLISLYFKATAPANAEFNGTGDIFTVEFTKTGSFASVDTATVCISALQESYFTGVETKAVSCGKAITFKDFDFNGSLRFWTDNSPIKYNAALPNDFLITKIYGTDLAGVRNGGNIFVTPNMSGNFTHNLNNGLATEIVRDIAGSTIVQDVVNSQDAFLGKNLILNKNTFTPNIYQIIALDVNIDGVVSAGDVSQISQRSNAGISEYRQAWNYSNAGVSNGQPSKDWIFVDSLRIQNNPAYAISATFPANDGVGFSKSRVPVTPFFLPATVTNFLVCPAITAETYKGIMLGDVNGNYDAYVDGTGTIKSVVDNGNRMIFDVANAVVNGNTVELPVSILSTSTVNNFDFAIKFNEEKLAYNEVVATSENGEVFPNLHAADRTLRVGNINMESYDLSKSVAVVRFDISKGALTAEDITSVTGWVNGERVVAQVNNLAAGLASINASANAVRIFPNPTKGLLNVVARENATVEVLDITGKTVLFQTTIDANVKQEINVDGFANGMYIVKVYNNNFNTVERVVVNK